MVEKDDWRGESANEAGPSRSTAVEEIRGKAELYERLAAAYRRRAAQLMSLARQLEGINKYAASVSNGGDGPCPTIGVGSDAEYALWQLVINSKVDDPL